MYQINLPELIKARVRPQHIENFGYLINYLKREKPKIHMGHFVGELLDGSQLKKGTSLQSCGTTGCLGGHTVFVPEIREQLMEDPRFIPIFDNTESFGSDQVAQIIQFAFGELTMIGIPGAVTIYNWQKFTGDLEFPDVWDLWDVCFRVVIPNSANHVHRLSSVQQLLIDAYNL